MLARPIRGFYKGCWEWRAPPQTSIILFLLLQLFLFKSNVDTESWEQNWEWFFFFQFIATAQNGIVLLQPESKQSNPLYSESTLFIHMQLKVSARLYKRSHLDLIRCPSVLLWVITHYALNNRRGRFPCAAQPWAVFSLWWLPGRWQ